jgi:hypothetical protein
MCSIWDMHCVSELARLNVEQYISLKDGVQSVHFLKSTIFTDVTMCSLAEVYQCFRGYCFHPQSQTLHTSKTLIDFFQAT